MRLARSGRAAEQEHQRRREQAKLRRAARVAGSGGADTKKCGAHDKSGNTAEGKRLPLLNETEKMQRTLREAVAPLPSICEAHYKSCNAAYGKRLEPLSEFAKRRSRYPTNMENCNLR